MINATFFYSQSVIAIPFFPKWPVTLDDAEVFFTIKAVIKTLDTLFSIFESGHGHQFTAKISHKKWFHGFSYISESVNNQWYIFLQPISISKPFFYQKTSHAWRCKVFFTIKAAIKTLDTLFLIIESGHWHQFIAR